VHEGGDQEARFSDSQAIAVAWAKAELITTHGLGRRWNLDLDELSTSLNHVWRCDGTVRVVGGSVVTVGGLPIRSGRR
jgi:hypothetical protein